MDGLELRVGDCRLCDRGEVIGVAEDAEVVHKISDELGRRRNVVSGAWVVVAAADPVLNLPEAAPVRLEKRAGKQTSMNLQEHVDRDLLVRSDPLHAVEHRVDVPEHLRGSHIRGWLAHRTDGLSPQEPARTDLQALDTRGGHRLRAQQNPREGLRIDECRGLGVQPSDRSFSVGNVGGHFALKHESSTDQRIGQIG